MINKNIKLKPKYREFTKDQLLKEAYELGKDFEKNSWSCSQSTVATLHEILGFDECLVRTATSSCAGTANQLVGTCGAISTLASGVNRITRNHEGTNEGL